ncbi:hypothetical protein O7599_19180 [Streptomyces sp. WMMC500]|uniref:hypothetical protein n=1 Tax=Streptomyces sp. WMMC500 TaxID=3015154 RepID=UPI00248CFA5F|nr:hypothetical protein [Streptomyces sp. WMMC500]WBB57805.1 hypothetical protein O7599_19180 [Streptomyces sp. WMMC500]
MTRVLLTAVYAAASAAGLMLGAPLLGTAVTVLLWTAQLGLLAVLLARLGGVEAGCYALVATFVALLLGSFAGQTVRDDLTLQTRGEEVQATVTGERLEKGDRGSRTWYYTLKDPDGRAVPGPELRREDDDLDPGDSVTVVADPEGEVRPTTPGLTGAVPELLGVAAAAAVCAGAVVWTARRAGRTEGSPGMWKKKQQTVAEQEATLRSILRARVFDRRGYIRVSPGAFPGLTQQRAAAVAAEEGLKTEGFGNRGFWRFGEQVVDEVAADARE